MEKSFDETSSDLGLSVSSLSSSLPSIAPSSSIGFPSCTPYKATFSPGTDTELPHPVFSLASSDASNILDPTFSTFWFENLFERVSLQDNGSSNTNIVCTCEDGFKADFYCHDCKEHLCEKCVSAHHRVSLTKMHHIVKADYLSSDMNQQSQNIPYSLPHPKPASNNCSVHTSEVLCYFCHTCSAAICAQCSVYDHSGHNFQHLQKVIESSKTSMFSMLAAAKNNLQTVENNVSDVEKMIDRVVARSKMTQSEIHSAIHKHITALKRRETELLNKVDQIRMLKCQVLGAQMDRLRSSASKLQMTIHEVNGIMNADESLKILEAKDKLQSCMVTSPGFGYVEEDDELAFFLQDAGILLALNSLGLVKSSACAQRSVLRKDGLIPNCAKCGSSVVFTIYARDHSGDVVRSKVDVFNATVRKPDSTIYQVDIMDSGNGCYVFRVHVATEGEFIVSVWCRGVPVCDSPYSLRVKHSVDYHARAVANAGKPISVFGKEGDKAGEFCRPWGICCNAQGYLIVADRSNNRIQIFNSDGTFHHMFGSSGTRPGQFDRPAGVAVDKKGNVVVADKDNHRIQIFHFDGTFVSMFGERGSKHGQFNYPWDVDVNDSGIIAVTDTRNHRIQLFSFDGIFLSKYGFEGAMWKHFDSPRGVAFTSDNRLVVTDFNNHRLVIINPDMKSARYLGAEGSQTSQFLRPQGVAVDEEGNIVVADSRNHRLQVFTPSGGLIAVFRSNLQGASPQMDRPSGITVTPDGHIAVVDFGNNRVLLF